MTAIEPTSLADMELMWKFAQRVCQTEFVPQAFRNRPDAVLAAIHYGRELGIGPMQSLQAIHVIQGKPSLAPEAMRARVFAAGHTIATEVYTDDECVLVGKRGDAGQASAKVRWTMEDAHRAGLIKSGGSWKTYPRAMLLARATSELCRLLFPDVIAGASYVPEELGDVDDPPPPIRIVATEIVDSEPNGVLHVRTKDVSDSTHSVSTSESDPGPDLGSSLGPDGGGRKNDATQTVALDLPPAAAGDEPPVTDIAISAIKVHDLQTRISALQALKVTVSAARKAAGLSLLKPGISVSEFAEWEALVSGLEREQREQQARLERKEGK